MRLISFSLLIYISNLYSQTPSLDFLLETARNIYITRQQGGTAQPHFPSYEEIVGADTSKPQDIMKSFQRDLDDLLTFHKSRHGDLSTLHEEGAVKNLLISIGKASLNDDLITFKLSAKDLSTFHKYGDILSLFSPYLQNVIIEKAENETVDALTQESLKSLFHHVGFYLKKLTIGNFHINHNLYLVLRSDLALCTELDVFDVSKANMDPSILNFLVSTLGNPQKYLIISEKLLQSLQAQKKQTITLSRKPFIRSYL